MDVARDVGKTWLLGCAKEAGNNLRNCWVMFRRVRC